MVEMTAKEYVKAVESGILAAGDGRPEDEAAARAKARALAVGVKADGDEILALARYAGLAKEWIAAVAAGGKGAAEISDRVAAEFPDFGPEAEDEAAFGRRMARHAKILSRVNLDSQEASGPRPLTEERRAAIEAKLFKDLPPERLAALSPFDRYAAARDTYVRVEGEDGSQPESSAALRAYRQAVAAEILSSPANVVEFGRRNYDAAGDLYADAGDLSPKGYVRPRLTPQAEEAAREYVDLFANEHHMTTREGKEDESGSFASRRREILGEFGSDPGFLLVLGNEADRRARPLSDVVKSDLREMGGKESWSDRALDRRQAFADGIQAELGDKADDPIARYVAVQKIEKDMLANQRRLGDLSVVQDLSREYARTIQDDALLVGRMVEEHPGLTARFRRDSKPIQTGGMRLDKSQDLAPAAGESESLGPSDGQGRGPDVGLLPGSETLGRPGGNQRHEELGGAAAAAAAIVAASSSLETGEGVSLGKKNGVSLDKGPEFRARVVNGVVQAHALESHEGSAGGMVRDSILRGPRALRPSAGAQDIYAQLCKAAETEGGVAAMPLDPISSSGSYDAAFKRLAKEDPEAFQSIYRNTTNMRLAIAKKGRLNGPDMQAHDQLEIARRTMALVGVQIGRITEAQFCDDGATLLSPEVKNLSPEAKRDPKGIIDRHDKEAIHGIFHKLADHQVTKTVVKSAKVGMKVAGYAHRLISGLHDL